MGGPGRYRWGSARRTRARSVSLTVLIVCAFVVASVSTARVSARRIQPALLVAGVPGAPATREVLDEFCIGCHNERLLTAGLALDSVDATRPEADPELWERVIAKLRAGTMPPPGRPRPDAAIYDVVAGRL